MSAYGFRNSSGHPVATDWLRLKVNDLTTGEKTPAGGSLKKGDIILDCFVVVHTAEATASTKTIDVGLNGSSPDDDPDGLLDGVSTAAVAVVKGTLDSGGQTLGTLLHVDESGGGVLVREPHVITQTDAVVTYTLGEAATELDAEILLLVARPPVAV